MKAKQGRAQGRASGLWAVVLVLAGCEGTQRSFAPLLPDDGVSDGGSEDAGSGGTVAVGDGGSEVAPKQEPLLLGLGEACTQAGQCESQQCVDGVCCDSPCGELCATCAAPGNEGTCSTSASDVACDALSCPAATECRGRDTSALALNCEGIGACRQNVECAPVNAVAGTPCQSGTGSCDGAGACVVPGKASLGEACSADDECAEGHCVLGATGEGICCDAACDGACQACSAEGHCEDVPASDDACEPVACPPDNPCFDYPDAITESLCRGFGQCRTSQSCTGTALRPASNCDCDTEGSCALRPGVACTNEGECSQGVCAPAVGGGSVCCTVACGAGLFCQRDGLGCVECEAGSIACEGSVEVSCSGGERVLETCANGCTEGVGCNDRAPVGFSCAAAECVTGAVCQADVGGVQRCCARDCGAEGKECSADGSCVCPEGQGTGTADDCLLQRGDPCGEGQCAAGLTCVDGVCCNEACDGACESCNQPGNAGTCTFASNDTAACGAGQECVGRDDCRGRPGESCTAAQDCVSPNCEPLVGVSGASACCAANCGGQTPFCSSDGNRCVECESNADCGNGCNVQTGRCNALRTPGATCSVSAQCGSGACLPAADNPQLNRCCPSCAPGQLCTAQGQCQDPPAGAGDGCTSDAQCETGLFCRDGVCCTSRCDGACQTCGGNGTCNVTPASDPQACPSLNCGTSTECRIVTIPTAGSCSALGQCAQCQTSNRPVGTDCGTDGDCDANGACRPNATPPSVAAGSLRPGTFVDFDTINLVFTPATDDRTPANQLEYAAFHATTNSFPTSPAQIVSAASTSGPIRTLRDFATGASLQSLVLPVRGSQHFVVVVVRDRSGNMAAYTPTQFTFEEPESCTNNTQCLSNNCLTLFADTDNDCRGDVNTTIRRCAAPTLSTGSCPQPRADLGTLRGVTSGTVRYVNNSLDCLDTNNLVFRNQPSFFPTAFAVPAGNPSGAFANGFDYNCSGQAEPALPLYTPGSCQLAIATGSGSLCSNRPDVPGYMSNVACGAQTDQVAACLDVGGGCQIGAGVAGVTKQCH